MRKQLDDENPETIRDFYFSRWHRSLDEYRVGLYNSLHELYGQIELGEIVVPDRGWVIELGVNRCQSFNELCELFGEDRCCGYDLENVTKHPRVRECDIRHLHITMPIALCVNEIGGWRVTPESRQAGFDWAVTKIVEDGILIEHSDELAEWNLLERLESLGFQKVTGTDYHVVVRKV